MNLRPKPLLLYSKQARAVSKGIIMSRIGLAKYFGALGRLQAYVSLDGKRFPVALSFFSALFHCGVCILAYISLLCIFTKKQIMRCNLL